MKNYPSDARIEIDNNLMENEIRPITLGRKNWLSIGSELGGEMAAVYLTLVANCKRLQINPRTYLEDVMRRLPGHDQTRIHELTPAAWKAEQAAKNA
ncbi:MAG: transposase [Kiritimatiellia bacterium]|jgi:transposase